MNIIENLYHNRESILFIGRCARELQEYGKENTIRRLLRRFTQIFKRQKYDDEITNKTDG